MQVCRLLDLNHIHRYETRATLGGGPNQSPKVQDKQHCRYPALLHMNLSLSEPIVKLQRRPGHRVVWRGHSHGNHRLTGAGRAGIDAGEVPVVTAVALPRHAELHRQAFGEVVNPVDPQAQDVREGTALSVSAVPVAIVWPAVAYEYDALNPRSTGLGNPMWSSLALTLSPATYIGCSLDKRQ